MSNLPPEILIEVFSNLTRDNKQQCLLVCKAWYATALLILNRFIEIKNSLKFLGVASGFVNQELFEYLFDRAGQSFELSINGRCLNSIMIHNVFNSLVNDERSFSTKRLHFNGSFIVSPELIAGINTYKLS